MTIGRNSRKTPARSSIRAPKFLDKSSGFYGRLAEPEAVEDGNSASSPSSAPVHRPGTDEREEAEVFDLGGGVMEDDGETLLQRKPSRHSSRWRRSSRRRQKEEELAHDDRPSLDKERPGGPRVPEDTRVTIEAEMEKLKNTEAENEEAGRGKELPLVHFPAREDADDQALIRDKKLGKEGESREQEDGTKVVKRNTMKNYRKALERAFRHGWETFITNLYSVTLTPVSPSSSSAEKKSLHRAVLAEFQ